MLYTICSLYTHYILTIYSQVFKDGLRVVTENGSSTKYWSEDDTKKLFELGDDGEQ